MIMSVIARARAPVSAAGGALRALSLSGTTRGKAMLSCARRNDALLRNWHQGPEGHLEIWPEHGHPTSLVVMHHPHGMDARSFQHVATGLRRDDHFCRTMIVLPNAPEKGDNGKPAWFASRRPDCSDIDVIKSINVTRALLESAWEKHPELSPSTTALVGHGEGGSVALRTAMCMANVAGTEPIGGVFVTDGVFKAKPLLSATKHAGGVVGCKTVRLAQGRGGPICPIFSTQAAEHLSKHGYDVRRDVRRSQSHWGALPSATTNEMAEFLKETLELPNVKDLPHLYVLRLEGGNFYVGMAYNLDNAKRRVRQHFSGHDKASEWTSVHPPVEVLELYPMSFKPEDLDMSPAELQKQCRRQEEVKTLELISEHGVDKVRGGTFSTVTLSPAVMSVIKRMNTHAKNRCYDCGSTDHYARDCPTKFAQ